MDFNKKFEEELAKLNAKQREAVDAIYGPVMVIAGPGTGKTQILASRIGNILRNDATHANPENILCLTYTDAGAINMRQRLLSLIGPDAYRISINTFHAFCNSVIQSNDEYFNARAMQVLSDLEKSEVLVELIQQIPSGNKLKRYKGDVNYDAPRLIKLFEEMEKEGWTVDHVQHHIQQRINHLKEDPEFRNKRKPDELKKTTIDEINRYEQSMDAATLFPLFQALLKKRQRYTYQEMILWVIDAFRKNDFLLGRYQEQFQYLLVDEYQDTNGAQNELLWLLTGDDPTANIFVVGDDDQAIYRFQGASSANMLAFLQRYEGNVKQIVLTDNYRSTQPILDASRHLITNNTDRLSNYIPEIIKHLESKSDFNTVLPPAVITYANEAQQTICIANEIERLKEQQYPLQDVAVIYRNNKEADTLTRYFEANRIPYRIRKSVNLLHENFIVKLISVLRYIDGESSLPGSSDHLLFEIMHYDFFDIEPLDIAALSVEMHAARKAGETLLWRNKIQTVSNDTDSKRAIRRLSDDIEYWVKNRYNITLQQLVEKVIVRGGILSYIMWQLDKHWHLEMLNSFFSFIKSECERNTRLDLTGLIKTLDLMEEENIELPLTKIRNNSNGVILTTAHSSKGEEYDTVFIINANSDKWNKRPPSTRFKLPQSLYSAREEFDEINDDRRLFFVAMTRAKTHLNISYCRQSLEGKSLEKSIFVHEISNDAEIRETAPEVNEKEVTNFQMALLNEGESVSAELFETEYLDHLLKGYQLSVTHLSTYLKCPVSFYFNNLLHVPTAKNENMEFGSAMHEVLQKIYSNTSDRSTPFLKAEEAKKVLHNYMQRHRESFTDAQFKNKLEYGEKIIDELYIQYIPYSHPKADVEFRLKNLHCEGVPINGIIDKLERYEKTVHVVDYKTSSLKPEKFKRPQPPKNWKNEVPSFEEEFGGDYWRQGVFYALLLENYHTEKLVPERTTFVFIEPDKKDNKIKIQDIEITDDDKTIVRQQIKNTWEKIQQHQFSEGCNKEDCTWCGFLNRTRKKMKTTELQTGNIETPEALEN